MSRGLGDVYKRQVYAYETDGFGMYNLMDDANVPSLLSMDYLGYPSDKEIAGNTRRLLLSEANPFYFKGERQQELEALIHLPTMFGILLWQFRDLQKLNRKRKWKF